MDLTPSTDADADADADAGDNACCSPIAIETLGVVAGGEQKPAADSLDGLGYDTIFSVTADMHTRPSSVLDMADGVGRVAGPTGTDRQGPAVVI